MFERTQISLARLNEAARELMSSFPDSRIFAFYGKMGSGKTTLIGEICRILETEDIPTSPSFTIVNEYQTSGGSLIYHFDFYRLKNRDEAYDLGTEDYFYSGDYCLIEWPEKIESLLPEHHVEVTITEEEGGLRRIAARYSQE